MELEANKHTGIPTFTIEGPLNSEDVASWVCKWIAESKIDPELSGWLVINVSQESAVRYDRENHDKELVDEINEELWKRSSEWKVSWLQGVFLPSARTLKLRVFLDLVEINDLMRI